MALTGGADATGAAVGELTTGAAAGELTTGAAGEAAIGVGEALRSGGGLGVCPRAVKARARVQKLKQSFFFIFVLSNEMRSIGDLDSLFSPVDQEEQRPGGRSEFEFVFARAAS